VTLFEFAIFGFFSNFWVKKWLGLSKKIFIHVVMVHFFMGIIFFVIFA
jgi:hypothetical protein